MGPMARSVVDVSRVYDVIKDPGSAPAGNQFETVLAGQEVAVKGLRVGLADDYFLSAADPEIASAIRDVADVFAGWEPTCMTWDSRTRTRRLTRRKPQMARRLGHSSGARIPYARGLRG